VQTFFPSRFQPHPWAILIANKKQLLHERSSRLLKNLRSGLCNGEFTLPSSLFSAGLMLPISTKMLFFSNLLGKFFLIHVLPFLPRAGMGR
jgi:hypothetical protein